MADKDELNNLSEDEREEALRIAAARRKNSGEISLEEARARAEANKRIQ